MSIIVKSEREIATMRQAGRIVASVLEVLKKELRVGMKTKELNGIAATELKRMGASPSFKGYRGFPANLCVSINDEIVHGIPGERIIKESDIVSLDLGAIYNGFQGDAAISVIMGNGSSYAESRGYSVVREYTGHGIGRQMHEEPQIPNFGRPGEGPELRKGMTIALEPMVNIGDWRTRVASDGWAVSTADGSLSAHFEHTIAITDSKPEVLTAV